MGGAPGTGRTGLMAIASAPMDRAALEALPRLSHEHADWERVRRTCYAVRQSIEYRYPAPIRGLRQRLVVVPPRRHGDQHTLGWGIDVSLVARRRNWTDGFGNVVVDFEVDLVETGIRFEAWSLVERQPAAARHRLLANPVFVTPTVLTTAEDALVEAADELAAGSHRGLALAERICDWVHRNMTYRQDVTAVDTTAAAALALGAGVCQDYAHIALALCRRCRLPARYVSGHLLGEGGSHAWIEVMVPDRDRHALWHAVAFDPTHNCRTGLTYLTIAAGRDYRDVAPMSGSYQASVSGALTVRKEAALVSAVYRRR